MNEQTKEMVYLEHKQLRLHPRNIRRYYPLQDVEEIAGSIKRSGNIQALLVTPIEKQRGMYWVVDGNMRLAGARHLGDDSPALKCEVLEASEAEQLLVMAITSEFHYPKDPISKAKHYKMLEEEEGLSQAEIAELMGLSQSSIYGYMRMLELDDEIQELIARGELGISHRSNAALLRISDRELRVKMARRFARTGASEKRILKSVAHTIRQLNKVRDAGIKPIEERPQPAMNGHKAATGKIADAPLVWELAEKTLCDECRLDGLGQNCWVCPGPYELINQLVEKAEFQLTKQEDNNDGNTV